MARYVRVQLQEFNFLHMAQVRQAVADRQRDR